MKILVTGSNGFIGTALVKSLIYKGYNVSRLIRPNSLNKIKDVNTIRIKGTSISEFKLALKSRNFDFVINLASYGVRKDDDNLDLMIDGNIKFLANLILALPNKPKMFINVGSCSEYGIIALRKHGIFKGSFLTAKRILRCNSLFKGGYDPVP